MRNIQKGNKSAMRILSAVASSVFLLIPVTSAAQEDPKPAGEKVRVLVYRYKQYAGKAVRPSIYVDEKDVARLQSGRCVILALAPGKHSFRSNDKQSQFELELKPGQDYYIRIDIASGLLKGHGRLTLVHPEQGAGEFKQMRPADAEMIKDRQFLADGFVVMK